MLGPGRPEGCFSKLRFEMGVPGLLPRGSVTFFAAKQKAEVAVRATRLLLPHPDRCR